MSYKENGVTQFSATVPYTVKGAIISYFNNRNVNLYEPIDLYANEINTDFTKVYVSYAVKGTTVSVNGENVTPYNITYQIFTIGEQKSITNFGFTNGSISVVHDTINKQLKVNATIDEKTSTVEYDYQIIPGNLDTELVTSPVTYTAIKNSSFVSWINYRIHKDDSLFEFIHGENISFESPNSFRINFTREINEMGYAIFYPGNYTSYYSLALYEGEVLVPVVGYQNVLKIDLTNYIFQNGQRGVLTVDTPYNGIYYRTEIKFEVIPQVSAEAYVHRLNSVYYYDETAEVLIEKGQNHIRNFT